MAYLVKYTVEFYEQNSDKTFTRKSEMTVNEKDKSDAEDYIRGLYEDNEENLVDIPEELVEGDNAFEFDSHINIDSVEKV